ncbi:hypothetical protein [Granulicella sp. dw_53]|uniref:hypothetical protein n=1 Tax=Granulicella sp. dw_53 TaxID=2719792 RepID=UPI001BD5315D|nr:hypothetical protein [Granulicella sp. dw_53]
MIDFDAYYTGYDTETVKASIRSGVDGTAAWNTQSGFLALYTANAGALNEAMRVSAIGNVGIGTALPQAKLEVAAGDVTGNFQVYNALTVRPVTGTGGYGGNGSSVYMSSSSNHGIVPIAGLWSALEDGGDGGVTYSGALVLGTTTGGNAAPVESVRINRFGNMGIGTNVPGEKLEVKGNIKLRRAVAAPSYFLTETSKAWPGQDLSAVETTLSRSTHRGITRNMSQVTCWF